MFKGLEGLISSNFANIGLIQREPQQGVIQEFAVEAVKHELGISNNRAEGFGGLCMSTKIFLYMASKCSENALK